MTLKSLFPLVWATSLTLACANTAPTVVIQSAAMRPGTTLMDVVYRVNDPDDATVKTRALAFVDGVRSFAKVIKPVTFVEGTAAKLGDAIPSNTNHTLTWDVAADWNVGLGQVKFEVLAMDGRGLLPFDWITIPAAGGNPALTISKDSPTDASVLDALFWQYADADPWLNLVGGMLKGNAGSGVFADTVLANGNILQNYSTAYIFKRMNLDPAKSIEIGYAANTARVGLLSTPNWHAVNRPYTGISVIVGSDTETLSARFGCVTAIAGGYTHSLALKSDGTVVGWGANDYGQINIPPGLSGVTAIAASTPPQSDYYGCYSLALKSDGTVVGWGGFSWGDIGIRRVSSVTAIAASAYDGLALKSDGTVVSLIAGGEQGPAGLSGVTAIAAGYSHFLALKSDGTVVGWGGNGQGQINIPLGLSGVTAIAAGYDHSLALKGDGTVVAWGANWDGQINIPPELSGVAAIAASEYGGYALKSDGTVGTWGGGAPYRLIGGLRGVTAIAARSYNLLAIKAETP